MTIERFILGMMVLIFIVQIASLVGTRSEKTAESIRLLGETLQMQADTLHYLIKRLGELERLVAELERRVNARKLPEGKRGPDNA